MVAARTEFHTTFTTLDDAYQRSLMSFMTKSVAEKDDERDTWGQVIEHVAKQWSRMPDEVMDTAFADFVELTNALIVTGAAPELAPGRSVEDVTFRNVRYTGTTPNLSIINGYDTDHGIRNITFEGMKINGQAIYDEMPGKPRWYVLKKVKKRRFCFRCDKKNSNSEVVSPLFCIFAEKFQ